jgi:hypothetical protein
MLPSKIEELLNIANEKEKDNGNGGLMINKASKKLRRP